MRESTITLPDLERAAAWAEKLDVHVTTLMRAYRRGELGGTMLAGRLHFSTEHIAEWIERHTRKAAA